MLNKRGFYVLKRYFCSASKAIKDEVVTEKAIGRMTGDGSD